MFVAKHHLNRCEQGTASRALFLIDLYSSGIGQPVSAMALQRGPRLPSETDRECRVGRLVSTVPSIFRARWPSMPEARIDKVKTPA